VWGGGELCNWAEVKAVNRGVFLLKGWEPEGTRRRALRENEISSSFDSKKRGRRLSSRNKGNLKKNKSDRFGEAGPDRPGKKKRRHVLGEELSKKNKGIKEEENLQMSTRV